MTAKSSSSNIIADRYASALYDLSLESKCVENILKDLLIIQEYFNQNNDFNLLIKSPLISSTEKLLIIEKILANHSANDLSSTFIKVISKNKRLGNLQTIISRFISINAEKRGDIIANITSADELSSQQKNGIKEQLSLVLGERLSLNFEVDNKLIGGLIVKYGSKMIDSSLSSKINKLKIAMEET